MPLFAALLLNLSSGMRDASAHCQIPCGIYDDPARFTAMLEHVATIEKSMAQIIELASSDDSAARANQLVRWTLNKEQHADELAAIITHYFMAQRIKPAPEDDSAAAETYARHLTQLHQMLVLAMKSKQSTELTHCDTLRELISSFQTSYLGN